MRCDLLFETLESLITSTDMVATCSLCLRWQRSAGFEVEIWDMCRGSTYWTKVVGWACNAHAATGCIAEAFALCLCCHIGFVRPVILRHMPDRADSCTLRLGLQAQNTLIRNRQMPVPRERSQESRVPAISMPLTDLRLPF